MQVDTNIVEASFLDVMDRFALDVFPTAGNISTDNISEYIGSLVALGLGVQPL